MNKKYIGLGILALLLSFVSVRADLVVSPETQTTCCDVLQYGVTISSPHEVQRSFNLNVEADDRIWASLEPDLLLLPPGESEQLTLFVRPACDMTSGEYTIKITSECSICNTTDEAEVTVNVENCMVVEPLNDSEDDSVENTTTDAQTDSPTGAIVSGNNDSLIFTALGSLTVIFAVIVLLIKKKSD